MPPVPDLPDSFTLDDVALLLGIAFAAGLAYLLARWLLATLIRRVIARANPRLATELEGQRVASAVALLAPAVVVVFAEPLLRPEYGWALELGEQLVGSYVVVVVALALHRLLGALEALLTRPPETAITASIHVAFRWLRAANVAAAAILALGAFANVQVTALLTVLGVLAAMGSLVFGDMIYNAVAHGILRGRKLVAEGDWLEVPALQINGKVVALGPQVVQVQNWDNTLATVTPRYLLSNTFRNWQQMYQVGTRRIFRYLYLDVATVRPLDDELRAAASEWCGVAAYLDARPPDSPGSPTATLTNAALYRAYLMGYLAAHPKVDKESTWRVTNEDAAGQGLPLLLLAYLTETADLPYRLLDAEIYEHALAVAPSFGLRVFQSPAGADLQAGRVALPAWDGAVTDRA